MNIALLFLPYIYSPSRLIKPRLLASTFGSCGFTTYTILLLQLTPHTYLGLTHRFPLRLVTALKGIISLSINMAKASRPSDFITPAQHKQKDPESRSDQAKTEGTRGKLGTCMARAEQTTQRTMTSFRHDIDTFKGYFRGIDSSPIANAKDKQNKSSIAPVISQGGQPPAPSDGQSSH